MTPILHPLYWRLIKAFHELSEEQKLEFVSRGEMMVRGPTPSFYEEQLNAINPHVTKEAPAPTPQEPQESILVRVRKAVASYEVCNTPQPIQVVKLCEKDWNDLRVELIGYASKPAMLPVTAQEYASIPATAQAQDRWIHLSGAFGEFVVVMDYNVQPGQILISPHPHLAAN